MDKPELDTVQLGIFATLAQWEREIISERTKAALAERKAQGVQLGNPRLHEAQPAGTAASAKKRRANAQAGYTENRAINCIRLKRKAGESYARIASI